MWRQRAGPWGAFQQGRGPATLLQQRVAPGVPEQQHHHPRTCQERRAGGRCIRVLSSLLGDSDAHCGLRAPAPQSSSTPVNASHAPGYPSVAVALNRQTDRQTDRWTRTCAETSTMRPDSKPPGDHLVFPGKGGRSRRRTLHVAAVLREVTPPNPRQQRLRHTQNLQRTTHTAPRDENLHRKLQRQG